ncbi:hypothetical protein VTL71DRAFT_11277 [Oculimacula yallundae]
MATTTNS